MRSGKVEWGGKVGTRSSQHRVGRDWGGGAEARQVKEMGSERWRSRKGSSFLLPLRLLHVLRALARLRGLPTTLVLVFAVLLLPPWGVVTVESKCRRPPVVFNFGDSNSDTGGLQAGLGYVIGLPDGRKFPGGPSGRVCDGRLVIDFLCESLNMAYLSPYLEALGSDFRNGANFAISGSSTMPRNVPFSLLIQVLQFLRFRSRSLQLIAEGSKHLISEKGFQNALYTFDIGQNDLSKLFSAGLSYSQVLEQIPSVLAEIRGAIKMIYERGGKHFWVHGTGPLGCLPQKLSLYKKDGTDVDACGCLTSFNNAAKALNDGLSALCDELSTELQNATMVYTDMFAIKYDLIANYTKYGFENPLMTCCGYGGPPYNFNINITCGNPASQACTDGSKYISWDGVHYSEAANAIAVSKILSTDYSKPRVKFESFCVA
uniref:GDSL esterase/lipase At1g09390 n=1 Tax=Anthurium amnicola TaxID=1678845 RepID=A0A1D1Z6V9_9ARAE